MDGRRAFGDDTSHHNISEKLKTERMKAFRALETADKSRNFNFKIPKSLTELRNSIRTPGLENSDYVPYTRCDSTNISDLVEENTINLNMSNTPVREVNKISFEPAEMTGRSTQYKPEKPKLANNTMTLEQILASSCSEKVRCLGESFRASFSNGSSLPRTADLSRSRTTNTTATESNPGLSFTDCPRADDSAFSNENFTPAEMMTSKLAAHEKEWEKEFATIPAAEVTIPSKNTSPSEHGYNGKSKLMNDPNFSIGAYFNQRSESIQNIIPKKKSPTRHAPMPLIDDVAPDRNPQDSAEECVFYAQQAHSEAFDDVPIIKLNDATFKPLSPPPTDSRYSQEPTLDKDDGSYSLSLSEIADALNNIGSDETCTAVMNRLLSRKGTKNRNNASKPLVDKRERSTVVQEQDKVVDNKSSPTHSHATSTTSPANKENVAPAEPTFHLSETVSFSESVLELSEIRKDVSIKTPQGSSQLANNSPSGENQNYLTNNKNNRSPSKSPGEFKQLPTYSETKKYAQQSSEQNKESRKRPFSSIRQTNLETEIQRHDGGERRSPSPDTNFSRDRSPTSSVRSSISQDLSPRIARDCYSPTFDNSSVSERRFLVDSNSPECGKISLPSYGLVSRTASATLGGGKWTVRSNSQCSTSSEYSHRDGSMPLKATCLEMSWGSTKLRKDVKKSVKIKNWSMKRLVVQVDVTGPGFQLVNHEPQNLLTLQGQECRTIVVSFCPTVVGSAVGKLLFKPPCGKDMFNAICLYGYGGHANIIPHGICKGPVGSAFLTMGELNQLPSTLVNTFTVYNKGLLTGFAIVLVDSLGLDLPRLRECIEVKPSKALIPPEGSVKFRINFKPRREDMKKIVKKISQVMTLANLKIISGDEPTRQRIRKLISQMKNSDKAKISSTSLDKVWNAFPSEMDIYDLNLLKEHSEVAHELISTLRTHDIALTLNHSILDETGESTLVFPDADETVMFRTIIVNPSSKAKSPKSEKNAEHFERQNIGTLKFQPSSLEMNPINIEKPYTITMRSFFPTALNYQMECNYKNVFNFVPCRGRLDPGDCVEIEITCLRLPPSSLKDLQIIVFAHNREFIIPVKILNTSPRCR